MFNIEIKRTPLVLLQSKVSKFKTKEDLKTLSWEERMTICVATLTVRLAVDDKLDENMDLFNWQVSDMNEALRFSSRIIYDLNRVDNNFDFISFLKDTIRLYGSEKNFNIHDNLIELNRVNKMLCLSKGKLISELASAVGR